MKCLYIFRNEERFSRGTKNIRNFPHFSFWILKLLLLYFEIINLIYSLICLLSLKCVVKCLYIFRNEKRFSRGTKNIRNFPHFSFWILKLLLLYFEIINLIYSLICLLLLKCVVKCLYVFRNEERFSRGTKNIRNFPHFSFDLEIIIIFWNNCLIYSLICLLSLKCEMLIYFSKRGTNIRIGKFSTFLFLNLEIIIIILWSK